MAKRKKKTRAMKIEEANRLREQKTGLCKRCKSLGLIFTDSGSCVPCETSFLRR